MTHTAPDAPLFDVDELVRRLVAITGTRSSDRRPRWCRWKALRRLWKTRARLVRSVEGSKLMVTPAALQAAWPDLYRRLVAEPTSSGAGRSAA